MLFRHSQAIWACYGGWLGRYDALAKFIQGRVSLKLKDSGQGGYDSVNRATSRISDMYQVICKSLPGQEPRLHSVEQVLCSIRSFACPEEE